jgi:CHC2 zinc finger
MNSRQSIHQHSPCRDYTSAALEAGKAAILADIADITAHPDEWSFPDGSKAVLDIYMADIEAELTRRSRLRLPPARRANQSADAIKKQVDIVQVAERYVARLRQVGGRYRCKCPMHDGESDTSLSVDAEQQLFYCFGCGIGGDVFDFLMWVAGCDFPGAVQLACIEAGIPKSDRVNFPSFPSPLWSRERKESSGKPKRPHIEVIAGKVVAS